MTEREDSSGKTGRPTKGDGPKVPYDEIDRLLVHGEVVEAESGGTTVVYPSYRTLARRYGCSHSLISWYARKHNTMRRRRQTQARVEAKADSKLAELRADAIAVSKDDQICIIDGYLIAFKDALEEGRVRCDNPSDFNLLCRLREFILGGADSRQEIHAALSLEDIQARHQRMLKASRESTIEQRGEVVAEVEPATEESRDTPARILNAHSPAPSAATASQDVTVQPGDEEPAPARGPTRAPVGPEDGATGGTP